MSVFAYNPDAVRSWAKSVISYLNEGPESIDGVSKKFSEQLEKLVQPNVWTGAAAYQNYHNFLDTQQALVNFVNSFGSAYEETMNAINRSVADLEIANLGKDTNVTSAFGTLSYNQLNALSEENISKETVRYDYATIASIGSSLNQVYTTLEGINSKLTSKINELNAGDGMWDGDAASNAKEQLSSVLKTNMDKVMETLNICIKNISAAAEAAQAADRGM